MSNFIIFSTSYLEEVNEDLINSISSTLKSEPLWKIERLKNTTLLILFKKLEIERGYQELCQKVEEDKYGFKKVVLDYNGPQSEELIDVLKKRKITNELLNDLVNDSKRFKDFSSENNLTSYYELLLKVFVKLPFLTIRNTNSNFEILKDTLNQKLGSNARKLTKTLRALDEIENLKEDEIINFLIKQSEDEKNQN
jgi:hypothetical protein